MGLWGPTLEGESGFLGADGLGLVRYLVIIARCVSNNYEGE